VQVVGDASGSVDPQGQVLHYVFDFGDGTVTGSQVAATASHTYAAAGSYVVKVTVTDTAGLSGAAQQTVTVTGQSAQPPAYVSQIATNYSTSTKTSGSITVWRAAGVRAGDLVVLTVQLVNTSASGAVSGTDASGSSYSTVSSVADASGNRLVVLAGTANGDLAPNAKIDVSFPSSAGYRIVGDEFSGVGAVDQTAAAIGTGATFSSGATTTSVGPEVVFAAVALPAGSRNPTWSPGWKDLGSYAVSSRYLGRAYQLAASPGSFNATGSASGAWLATTVTFRP
jgi:hypothetical protein